MIGSYQTIAPVGQRSIASFALMITVIVDDRQVVDHRDQAVRCIDGASAAGIAAYVAVIEYGVAVLEVHACDPQAMTHGMQREQILGAGIDAVAAGRAQVLDDDR